MTERETFTDRQLLRILEMKEHGKTLGQISSKFGCSRSRISGAIHRIQQACNAQGPWDEHDGTMPRTWWRDGLDARAQKVK